MLRILCLLLCLSPVAAAAEQAQRIISLGSSVTETIYALGEGVRLVAVDSTSQYPAAARALPDVGYVRTLAAEGILSLTPDLVLASHEAGPPQVLTQLRNAGVRVEVLQTGPSAEHALQAMARIGTLLGKAAAGQQLAEKNRSQLQQLQTKYQTHKHKPKVLFVLGGHGAQPTISGGDTKANSMIELAIAENAATQNGNNFTSYRPSSPEALLGMQPEVIVAASHGVSNIGGIDKLINDSGLALSPAGKNGRVIVMDSALLLGMGPRMGEAATELANRIHQQTAKP